MRKIKFIPFVGALLLSVAGCNEHSHSLTGKACLGTNNDTLVESLGDQCQAGDMIGTKHPAYFCDFSYAVAFNQYNSAFCVFSGAQAEERIQDSKSTSQSK
ncbi:hypothetical protein [Aquipseudomonas alcaligenes]|uniref:hypothetical protein n=1 Tax=Aquipseudomonas alcaligenes TaxID=43263 RepID=UPI001659C94E|nr:hypothetical protein [Pseudomonas alcaligenes]